MLRTFIALETPETDRRRFSEIQAKLKESSADVKWEPENKFHATVKFLGDTKEEIIPNINEIIKKAAAAQLPFTLVFNKVGFFPNWRRPRVVWIGCSSHDPAVSHMKSRLDNDLKPLGFEIEQRTFHPHITFGRIKSEKDVKHLLSIAESLTFEPTSIAMDELILIKSILRPEGSEYFLLEKFKFGSQAH